MINKIKERFSWLLDGIYTAQDKRRVLRASGLRHIPKIKSRRGGKVSYAEWGHVIGIFQSLLHFYSDKENLNILDIGCGTGLIGLAAFPHVNGGGSYTGIDVRLEDIDFCKKHFESIRGYSFYHLDTYNASYSNHSNNLRLKWPIENSFDFITALSVWTHFSKDDAEYYLKEVNRGLSKSGYAVITIFCLDHIYYENVSQLKHPNKFHNHNNVSWIFDREVTEGWYTTKWAMVPEDAIAIKWDAIVSIVNMAGLEIERYFPGNWKNYPGLYFQDILIIKRKA